MKRFIIASLAGAIIAFLWGLVSWEFLSWHKMNSFKDGDAVAKILPLMSPPTASTHYPIIGWTLAGLVIAFIIKPPRAKRIFS